MFAHGSAASILGLVLLFGLTFAGGHRWLRALERRLGITMLAASGLSFVLLGALLGRLGLLSGAVLEDLRPVVEVALGLAGFRLGTEFDVRELELLPFGMGALVVSETATAVLLAGVGGVAILAALVPAAPADVIRWGLLLGACAAVSAPSGARALEASGVIDAHLSRLLRSVAVYGDAAAIVIVAFLFRPSSSWALPWLGWVLVQLGLGAAAGLVTLGVADDPSDTHSAVLTFAAVAFTAGLAGYMGLSPLVVGTIAGVVVATGSRGRGAGRFADLARDVERPVYLLLFAVVGAEWNLGDGQGWMLLPFFVLARLAGKYLGPRAVGWLEPTIASRRSIRGSLPPIQWATRSMKRLPMIGLALLPTSATSIAILADAMIRDVAPAFLQTPVIVGGLFAELMFRRSLPADGVAARRPA